MDLLVAIALVLAVLYFLFFPLVLLFTFKAQANPTIDYVDPSDGMPDEDLDFFADCHEQFQSLSFHYVGTFCLPDSFSNVRTILALYQNYEQNIGAISSSIYANINGEWNRNAQYVELLTEFSDDFRISTGNQKQLGAFPKPENLISTQHPELQEIDDLYRAHRAMINHHANNKTPILKLSAEFDSNVELYLLSFFRESYERAANGGIMNLHQGDSDSEENAFESHAINPYQSPGTSEPDRNASYGLTTKGAFKLAYQELWPLKPIVYRLKYSKDHRILAETGFEWS